MSLPLSMSCISGAVSFAQSKSSSSLESITIGESPAYTKAKMCNKKNILIHFHSAESLCRAQKGTSN